MLQPILHHYDISPFSEKVRLVFGLKGIAWQSVIIPDVLPKPEYAALTGGYRRTPSLQIGADIYCDTRLIVAELERRYPSPTLFPQQHTGLHRALEAWAESSLFWPCARAVVSANVEALPAAFHADRAAMRGLPPPTPARVRRAGEEAQDALRVQMRWVENLLAAGAPFVLGAAPGLADFAIYHALWFLEQLPRRLLRDFTAAQPVYEWMARIAAIGHGTRTELSAAAALEIAAATPPVAMSRATVTCPVGQQVAIEPEERTSAAVLGEVVGGDEESIVIRRHDPRAGTVHVHFPRLGYRVRDAAA